MKKYGREKNMFELIPSQYMRECYRELNFTFTDFQKATLIWNSPGKKRQEILDALKELAADTKDFCTKRQIQERLDYERKAFEKFKENDAGKYVYVVAEREDNENAGFFSEYERAFQYAKRYMKKYEVTCSIEKQRIVATPEDETVRNPWKENPNLGLETEEYCAYSGVEEAKAGFNCEGEAEYFYSRELPEEEKIVDTYRIERFESHFMKIPAPLQTGCPVRNVVTGTYGILAQSEEEWEKYLKWIEDRELYVDFSDVQMIVFELNESGIWIHNHVNPLYLEVENPPVISGDEKQDAFRRAMEAMYEYLRHEKEENCEARYGGAVLQRSREFAQICQEEKCDRRWKDACKAEDIMS